MSKQHLRLYLCLNVFWYKFVFPGTFSNSTGLNYLTQVNFLNRFKTFSLVMKVKPVEFMPQFVAVDWVYVVEE